MAAIAGYGGQVTLTAAVVEEVKEWTLNVSNDLLDTTSMKVTGGGWKTFIGGLKGATGTIRVNWDVVTDTDGQKILHDALIAGTTVSNLYLYVNNTNKYTIASAFIQAANPRAAVNGVTELTFNFTATGSVTYA